MVAHPTDTSHPSGPPAAGPDDLAQDPVGRTVRAVGHGHVFVPTVAHAEPDGDPRLSVAPFLPGTEAAVRADVETGRFDATTPFDYLFRDLRAASPHATSRPGTRPPSTPSRRHSRRSGRRWPNPPRWGSTPRHPRSTPTGASSSTTTSRSTRTAATSRRVPRRNRRPGTRCSATSWTRRSGSSRPTSWWRACTTGGTRRSTSTASTGPGRSWTVRPRTRCPRGARPRTSRTRRSWRSDACRRTRSARSRSCRRVPTRSATCPASRSRTSRTPRRSSTRSAAR